MKLKEIRNLEMFLLVSSLFQVFISNTCRACYIHFMYVYLCWRKKPDWFIFILFYIFFPYNGYVPRHQSVGWEACLVLFIDKVFNPLFFSFLFFSESCEKKLGRAIADNLKDFGQDGFANLLG